ncbi:signal peptidase [Ralstonia sp. A12]|uniref:VirK family protein n=1 Tax=Ralstonia sp. A12 TaxID=1217052 RepID=UPI000573BF3B|nr:VirK family protein [Ralstonia sp. A12]KHK51025.1 signal peptidase [Ralstonia sp. A12]
MTKIAYQSIVCVVACVPALPVLAQGPLLPTQDLLAAEHALAAGKQLSATIDLTRCNGDTGNTPAGTTRGGLTVGAYRILPDNTLSFADTHFTVKSDGTPITQFLRYTIDTTGTARFSSYIFAMPAYTLQSQVSYTCQLGDGVKLFVQY